MNSKIEKSNSLTDLAARIRTEHETIRRIMENAVQRALTTGDMLLEAKEQLEHGQWMPWLRDHCGMPQRTANLYMRLAKGREVIEASDIAGLTLNAAARLLAPPQGDEEKLEDKRTLWTQFEILRMELIERLQEIKAALQTPKHEEEFMAWLQREISDPIDFLETTALILFHPDEFIRSFGSHRTFAPDVPDED
jgi:hypothetical protein